MALKKVRRPITKGEREFMEVKELDKSEYTTNSTINEENPMNNFNEEYKINDVENVQETILNIKPDNPLWKEVIISFEDDGKVNIPRKAKVDEGHYDFRIDDVRFQEDVKTKLGMKDQFIITFSLYNDKMGEVKQLSLPYNISSHPQSGLMKFLGAFKEVFRGRKVTILHLVGLTGQARIHHVVSETGNVFEKIEILNVENPNT